MRIAIVLVIVLSLMLGGCELPLGLGGCPTDDVVAYLSCTEARPSYSILEGVSDLEGYPLWAEWMIAWCADPPAEWLPVLDRSAKSATRKTHAFVGETLKAIEAKGPGGEDGGPTQEEIDNLIEGYDSLTEQFLFPYMVFQLAQPAVMSFGRVGHNLKTHNCVDVFREIEGSGYLEQSTQELFFSVQYWHFNW